MFLNCLLYFNFVQFYIIDIYSYVMECIDQSLREVAWCVDVVYICKVR